MRKLTADFFRITGIALMILYSNLCLAQEQIVQVGVGEYSTIYRTNTGKLYTAIMTGSSFVMSNIGLNNIIDVEGAQYTNVALDSDGKVYIVGINPTTGLTFSTPIPTDNTGNPFIGNTKVYGWYQGYLSLRDGKIWTWGQDMLTVNGGANIAAPVQLNQPLGKTFRKLTVSTQGEYCVMALATDGTVWRYVRGTASIPIPVILPAPARDIASVGAAAYVIETDNDLYAWGLYGSYVGGFAFSSTPTSVKAKWTAAGCVFPSKQLIGNYNTLHIIDQNDNMFAAGSNIQGEIGNGIEYGSWKTRTPNVWMWNFSNNEMVQVPVQIPGKFKNIFTSNTISFYHFAQDMGDNWYSWGRNKTRSLGNGITLGYNDEATYPEFRNVPAPTLVTPLTTAWTIVPFNPNGPQQPLANAGVNQYISTSTSTLYGQGSSQQDGTIATYAWTKISGPFANIVSPSLKNTPITGLVNGTYVFEIKVTNTLGATATSRVTVVVTGVPAIPNQPPVATAGNDITITLPANTTTLNGSGSDSDGTIVSYAWVKLTGTGGILSNANAATATAAGLTQGIYTYQLTVTDNSGGIGKDTVQVTVLPAPNQPPVANAGNNISITLPINSTTLNGSGTDTDGTIASYVWVKLTGTGGTLTNANTATANAAGLTQGIYTYQLTVTDNAGATGKDTVQVTVLPAINQPPVANAGNNISLILPINSTTLNGSGTDNDGTIVSYAWVKLTGTAGTLTNANTATATASGLIQGIYTYQLTVTDNAGATGKDTVQVIVLPAINQPPVANAGNNISLTLPINSTTLTGSGTDNDGTITSYSWVKLTGTGGTLTNANTATANAAGLTQGIYTYQLTVTDNAGATGKDTVQVTVLPAINQPPVANAGNNISITLPINSTTLTGSGTDNDGTIVSYAWVKLTGTGGTLTNANTATATASGLTQGIYTYQLTVTDNAGASARDTVQVTVNAAIVNAPNAPPTAHAGLDKSITLPTNSVTLTGTATDSDGTIVSFSWTKVSGPAAGSIVNSTAATTNVINLTQGIYEYKLTVTDNDGATDTDTVRVVVNAAVVVLNKLPVANAGQDVNIYLPENSTMLVGSGIDPDGTIAAYKWKVLSGPAQYSFTNTVSAATEFSGLQQGVYEVELTVTDNSGANAMDTVTVSVGSSRTAPAARDNDLKVYPNPVQNTLNAEITVSGLNSNVIILLYDIRGTLILQKEVKVDDFLLERIDMSRLKSGTYLMHIVFDDQTKITKKIIKQ